MLTDLQRRVRGIVARLPESGVFALAGGAALIVSGIVARPTNDLDFFAPHPQSVEPLLQAARAALGAEGLEVVTSQRVRRSRGCGSKQAPRRPTWTLPRTIG